VIVHGHFVTLQVLPPPESQPEPSQPAPRTDGQTSELPETTLAKPRPTAVAAAKSPPEPTPAVSQTSPRRSTPPAGSTPSSILLAISGGLNIAAAPSELAGFGQAEVGWFPRSNRFLVRAAVSIDSPITLEGEMDRVKLQRMAGSVGAGTRLEWGRAWVQPLAAVGAALWQVDALDLDGGASPLRVHPTVSIAATLGMPVNRSLALRAEANTTLFLVSDRYLIEPGGEVARSPRGAVSLGVGIEWATEL